MKKLIIGMGIAAMVMGMAVGANAAVPDTQWQVKLGVASSIAGASLYTSSFGTMSTIAADGWDSKDVNVPSTSAIYALAYTTISTKPGEIYSGDMRSPFTGTPSAKTWDITVSKGGAYTTGGAIWLYAWNPVDGLAKNDFLSGNGETIKLYDVTSGTRSLLWTVNGAKNGTGLAADVYNASTNPSGNTFALQIADGTKLQLEVAMPSVPEPGSMVAMLSGLAGLVGFGVRRKK